MLGGKWQLKETNMDNKLRIIYEGSHIRMQFPDGDDQTPLVQVDVTPVLFNVVSNTQCGGQ